MAGHYCVAKEYYIVFLFILLFFGISLYLLVWLFYFSLQAYNRLLYCKVAQIIGVHPFKIAQYGNGQSGQNGQSGHDSQVLLQAPFEIFSKGPTEWIIHFSVPVLTVCTVHLLSYARY